LLALASRCLSFFSERKAVARHHQHLTIHDSSEVQPVCLLPRPVEVRHQVHVRSPPASGTPNLWNPVELTNFYHLQKPDLPHRCPFTERRCQLVKWNQTLMVLYFCWPEPLPPKMHYASDRLHSRALEALQDLDAFPLLCGFVRACVLFILGLGKIPHTHYPYPNYPNPNPNYPNPRYLIPCSDSNFHYPKLVWVIRVIHSGTQTTRTTRNLPFSLYLFTCC
jgi:hypothetical protein